MPHREEGLKEFSGVPGSLMILCCTPLAHSRPQLSPRPQGWNPSLGLWVPDPRSSRGATLQPLPSPRRETGCCGRSHVCPRAARAEAAGENPTNPLQVFATFCNPSHHRENIPEGKRNDRGQVHASTPRPGRE